ncbi:hypothetical protein P350_10840 [Burkholderia cepacia JBK9]|nr:hypothetical protein P350_10840 [Burkholderia cepacia JBK9]
MHSRLTSCIEEEDICELEQIDPHRAWRSEPEFQVGVDWNISGHQLRRSLALYAQRSGLVSLPSLKRQLHHITEEMSRYYARGSAFAKDFIGDDDDHFGLEWQDTQAESAGLSYILKVLLSEEILIGGHANWVQQRMRGPDGILLTDRTKTIKMFRKGQMAYRETLLGGCVSVEECDKVAIHWLNTDCLTTDCKNLVCSLPKLDRTIAAQKKFIAGLDPDSVEYRTEMVDLRVLVAARKKGLEQRARGAR